jgi:hypothetical protein
MNAPMIRLDNISKQHGHQILFIDASMGLRGARHQPGDLRRHVKAARDDRVGVTD